MLAEAAELLRRPDVRLLTLVGAGGAGKTRLAVELATSVESDGDDGPCFVDLSSLREATEVLPAIARTLGIAAEPGGSVETLVQDAGKALEQAQLLLVLDNFEHVLAAASHLTALMEGCPGLKLLATSRTRLRLRWEHALAVPPLELPDPASYHSLAAVERSPAVRLFVQRARAASPGFALTAENAAAVAEVCALQDGLPLAIEHAASSAELLSPRAMVDRLRQGQALPAKGAVDLPLRQQSLRNVVAWSYSLLSPELKLLFARLAVFEGGCTLAAALAVCRDDDGSAPRPDPHQADRTDLHVLSGLQALMDRALLCRSEGADGEARFRMLETVRACALQQLMDSGEGEVICQRHAAYFLDLAADVKRGLGGSSSGRQWADLAPERRNLWAALAWSIRSRSPIGLRLSATLWHVWRRQATAGDARAYLPGILSLVGDRPESALHAGALLGAGALAERLGEAGQAQAIYERSFAVAKKAGARPLFAHAELGIARTMAEGGSYAAARPLAEQALAHYKKEGDAPGEADALHALGSIALQMGDHSFARTLYQQSLHLCREIGDAGGSAQALLGLGGCAFFNDDHRTAQALFEESQKLLQDIEGHPGEAVAFTGRGVVALETGDLEAARSYCVQGLTMAAQADDRRLAARALLVCAALAAALDQPVGALRLAGAAARYAPGRAALPPIWHEAVAPHLARAEHFLGPEAAQAAYAAGRLLRWEQAVADAAALASPPAALDPVNLVPPPGGGIGQDDPTRLRAVAQLTRRETEIAVLVAQGYTNRQVATMLVVSDRTVDTHVEHILKKLKMRSRAQVGSWVAAHNLLDQSALVARPA